jgi:hypothetical protein
LPVELPTLQITVGDMPVRGAVSVRIEQAAFFRAGRFAVSLAMGAPPLWGIADYARLSLQTLTISVATSGFGFLTLITGQIDNVVIDCAAQRATLSGRDLSARLIDTETAESFLNQTASDVAITIAGRHGLVADVVPTTAVIGQYYELDHARSALITHSRIGNEWDLLVWLAQAENYFVSVSGINLYFGPMPVISPVAIDVGDCLDVSIDIALALPNCAAVKSWNSRDKMAVTQVAGTGSSVTTLVKPNLSSAQALDLATSHLAALAQHVTILDLKLPGELNLAPGGMIYLTGTGSALDQVYVIEEIVREIDVSHGFVETIRGYAAS